MKKQTVITGGRLSVSRLRRALKLTHDCDYDVVLTLKSSDKYVRYNSKITNNSCLIFIASTMSEFMRTAGDFHDGVLLDLRGEDEKLVHPDIIICVSKKSLGSLINGNAMSRRFNIIDLDDEI